MEETPNAASSARSSPWLGSGPAMLLGRARPTVFLRGRGVVWVVAAALGVTAVAVPGLRWQQDRTVGLAARRAAQALALVDNDPAQAASLVVDDVRKQSPAPETAYAAREALQQLRHVRQVRRAQGAEVTAIHVDPTTQLAFVADDRGRVAVWSGPAGSTVSEGLVPGAPITTLDYCLELRLLVTGDDLGGIWLWQLDAHQRLQQPMRLAADDITRNRRSEILRAFFYDGGRRLVAVPVSGPLLIWDLRPDHGATWTRESDLSLNPGDGDRTAVSAPGDETAAGAADVYLAAGNGIQLVHLPSSDQGSEASAQAARTVVVPPVDPDKVLDLASFITDGGTRLAAVSTQHGLRTWWIPDHGDPVAGVAESPPSESDATSVAFTADGTALVTSGQGGVQIRPLPSDNADSITQMEPKQLLPVAAGTVGALPGRACFAVSLAGDVYDLSPTVDRTGIGQAPGSTDLLFDPADRLITTHLIKVSNRTDGLQVSVPATDPLAGSTMTAVGSYLPDPTWWLPDEVFFINDLAGDDRLLVAGGQTPAGVGAVMVWDARTRRPLKVLQVHASRQKDGDLPDLVRSVAIFPTRDLIVASTAAGELIGWSSRTWQEQIRIRFGWGGMASKTLVHDRWLLIAASDSSEPRTATGAGTYQAGLLDLDNPQDVRPLAGESSLSRLAASPSDDLIAVAGSGREITFIDSIGNRSGRPIELPAAPRTMAFSPDGRRLAVSLDDGQVVILDVATRTSWAPITSYTRGLYPLNLAWNQDGSQLAVSVGRDGDGHFIADHVNVFSSSARQWSEQLAAALGAA